MNNKYRKPTIFLVAFIVLTIGIFGKEMSSNTAPSHNRYMGQRVWKLSRAKGISLSKLWRINLGQEQVLDINKATLRIDYKGKLPSSFSIDAFGGEKLAHVISHYVHKSHTTQVDANTVELSVSPELISQIKGKSTIQFKIEEDTKTFQIEKVSLHIDRKKELVKNTHSIEGYTPRISYNPGETLEVKVHAPESQFNLQIFRYGKNEQKLYEERNIRGMEQDYPRNAYRVGANWKTSYSFKIPENWKSGLYACRISDKTNNEFFTTFVIKDRNPNVKKIGVIASTNTWSAYNTWGGASFYRYLLPDELKPKMAQIVNTQRPNLHANPTTEPNHLVDAERLILRWLEENGYDYSLITDTDLNDYPDILKKFNTTILNTHAEYWTESMCRGLQNFLDEGGNLAFLSANGMYGKAVLKENYIEVRKSFSPHVLNGEKGGLWRNLGFPESKILGVKYTPSGFETFAPYKVLRSDHWVFSGTGLRKFDLIGQKGVNKKREGASGHELDKMDEYTPINAVLLAKGTNPGDTGAEMIYYDHKGGGGVFSVGSITFGNSLVVDSRLSKMLKNVLDHFLSK